MAATLTSPGKSAEATSTATTVSIVGSGSGATASEVHAQARQGIMAILEPIASTELPRAVVASMSTVRADRWGVNVAMASVRSRRTSRHEFVSADIARRALWPRHFALIHAADIRVVARRRIRRVDSGRAQEQRHRLGWP